MAAGRNIDNIYIQTYEENVRHLAQQMNAKFRGTVIEKATNGNKHNWETLDFSNAVAKTAACPPTPDLDLPWNRRVSTAATIHTGTSYDNEDIVQMLVDPESNSAYNLAMAMNRSIDDVIISAIASDATAGDGSAVSLPAGQQVGDGTTVITFDDITAIQEIFMKGDVDPAQPKFAAIGPTQVRKLLQLTEQTSADYTLGADGRRALQSLNASGVAYNWMGFNWIMSTRLEAPAAGQKRCLFWTPDSVGMQMNEDITVQVAARS